MKKLLLLLIKAYQTGISAYTPASCIYSPVCSNYAQQALVRHGLVKGVLLAIWRILRCNPLQLGGLDPVPAPGMWKNPKTKNPKTSDNPHSQLKQAGK